MLVILYISCEARTVVENTQFRHILDDDGEMASDLVAKLAE
jgi:parvulin-like peptidyl-prolyl isomerase